MFTSRLAAANLIHRVRPGSCVAGRVGNELTFLRPDGTAERIDAGSRAVARALLSLAGGGMDVGGLTMLATDGCVSGVELLDASLESLQRGGLLEFVWQANGQALALVTELRPEFRFSDGRVPAGFVLSRFAYVRRDGAAAVLESPEALCRIEFTCPEAWQWIGTLTAPASLGQFAAAGQHRLLELADLLWRTGFLEDAGEEEQAERSSWEFHDMLFHWRSRGGRVSGPQAGTYRFLGRWDPPPAVKPRMSKDSVLLAKPEITDGRKKDGSLTAVVERRRSRRDQGKHPITLAHLGRLLYHVARVQQRLPDEHQELLLKPVPAAGAVHELELYLVVDRCDGLDRGLYHYHSEHHTLNRLPSEDRYVRALVSDAAEAWAKPEEPPQVLIVLASRLPRLAWKYEGLAYRLTLLHAGAMIEALYLAATEMGLACCAIGGGDSSVFAAATGLDPFAETSVAEFAVGSLRRGS